MEAFVTIRALVGGEWLYSYAGTRRSAGKFMEDINRYSPVPVELVGYEETEYAVEMARRVRWRARTEGRGSEQKNWFRLTGGAEALPGAAEGNDPNPHLRELGELVTC